MAKISVIVCTRDPRPGRLEGLFASLKGQILSRTSWELLVVDNSSTDGLAERCDLSWHPQSMHVRERNPGLIRARLLAIAAAGGELLVFVDDDNVLTPDFLTEAWAIYKSHPHLGVFGAGRIEPEFEISPPPELRPRMPMLAVRSVDTARWSNYISDVQSIPMGAGLCVTRRVADSYRRFVSTLESEVIAVLGRRGKALFCGDDDMFSWVAASAGYGFGIFPRLRLTHLISADRLNRHYFLRLIHDHSFSHGIIQYVFAGNQPRRIDSFAYAHMLLHGIRNGHFSMQCRWAEMRGAAAAAQFIVDHRLERSTHSPLEPEAEPQPDYVSGRQ